MNPTSTSSGGGTPADDDIDDGLDEVTEVTAPEPGRGGRLVAGRYAVDRQLAKGGMGEVLVARHVDLGRKVALKVMAPPQSEHAIDFEERFRTEARTLAGFVHPHIVTVHDFGVLDDGRCFLAMEFIEGHTLAEELKRGPLAPSRAVRLALQVCSALRYAHERGVVHRDLTPSNVILTEGPDHAEHAKLVDWGIAKVEAADVEATQNGVVLGSPHVMAPEQIDGVDVDARTDVYQLGVLLFRLLTGVYPFRGATTMAILMAHLEQPVPRFAEVAPDVEVPEGLEAIVRRCLAKDPADRWPGIDALREELAAALALPESAYRTAAVVPSAALREAAAARGAKAAPAPVRPFPWVWVAAALVLAAVGLGMLAVVGLQLAGHADAPPVAEAPVEPAPPAEGAASAAPAEVADPGKPADAAPVEPTKAPARASAPEPVKAKPKPSVERESPPPEPKRTRSRPSSPGGYEGLPDDF